MRRPRLAGGRAGFTLIEMLVALTLTAIIGAAITALFVGQERAFDTQTKLQSAREVSRGARNLITSELRMLERDSGVVSAAADELVLRVPAPVGAGLGRAAVNVLPVISPCSPMPPMPTRPRSRPAHQYVDRTPNRLLVTSRFTAARIGSQRQLRARRARRGPGAPPARQDYHFAVSGQVLAAARYTGSAGVGPMRRWHPSQIPRISVLRGRLHTR
jgi:prepilin-type N-terminal cleavage/methylation domain-containing protein